MKKEKIKFIRLSVLFVLVLFLLLSFLNIFYTHIASSRLDIYKNERAYNDFINLQNSSNLKVGFDGVDNISKLDNYDAYRLNYAFFGDSHAQKAISTINRSDSFNFALGGESYVETYFDLLRKLDAGLEINNIILSVDLHTFSAEMRTKEKLFREIGYYLNFISIYDISKLKGESFLSLLVKKYFPSIGKGGMFLQSLESNLIKKHQEDFYLSNMSKVADKNFISSFGENPVLFEKTSFNYFIKILFLAKDHDMNIIFIDYPVSKAYDDVILKKNISRTKFYSVLFKNVEQVIGDNYSFLDYYDIYFNNPEYFVNADHLSNNASILFSNVVFNDLANLTNSNNLAGSDAGVGGNNSSFNIVKKK